MNTNGTLIDTLGRSNLFREYEEAFTTATGLPLSLRPVETWKLPYHGKSAENRFCALVAGQSKTCAACLRLQERLAQSAREGPATLNCPYGLCETAVPVKLGDHTIGFLQTGQVLRRKPREKDLVRLDSQLRDSGATLDHGALRTAYLQTSVVPDRKLESINRLMAIFADHLSMKSNQLAVQTANSEPAMITRARQFIEEHHMEPLSLTRVASAVHASTFYFCKMFKKTTGITFTEHVSRVRTEKAKNLLLNPNLRISEIAYEVGFQSLTHFNRIFHKIVGQSPTHYRNRLPKAAPPAIHSRAARG